MKTSSGVMVLLMVMAGVVLYSVLRHHNTENREALSNVNKIMVILQVERQFSVSADSVWVGFPLVPALCNVDAYALDQAMRSHVKGIVSFERIKSLPANTQERMDSADRYGDYGRVRRELSPHLVRSLGSDAIMWVDVSHSASRKADPEPGPARGEIVELTVSYWALCAYNG